jgi:hypothetical protein
MKDPCLRIDLEVSNENSFFLMPFLKRAASFAGCNEPIFDFTCLVILGDQSSNIDYKFGSNFNDDGLVHVEHQALFRFPNELSLEIRSNFLAQIIEGENSSHQPVIELNYFLGLEGHLYYNLVFSLHRRSIARH